MYRQAGLLDSKKIFAAAFNGHLTALEGLNLGDVPEFACSTAVLTVSDVLVWVHDLVHLLLVVFQVTDRTWVETQRRCLRHGKSRAEILCSFSSTGKEQIHDIRRFAWLRPDIVWLLAHRLVVLLVRHRFLMLVHFDFGRDFERFALHGGDLLSSFLFKG